MKKFLRVLAALALIFCCAVFCTPQQGVKIISSRISSFDFAGFGNIGLGVSADVYNAGPSFSIQDISGSILLRNKCICTFTADPIELEGRDTCTVKTSCRLTIQPGTDFITLYSMIRENNLSNFTLNWKAVAHKGVLHKEISGNGVPLGNLVKL